MRRLAIAVTLVLLALAGCTQLGHTRAAAGPPPVLDAAPESAGALAGGETVTFTGEHLTAVTRVVFGEQDAAFRATNAELEVTVPNAVDYTPGTVPVTIFGDAEEPVLELRHDYRVLTAVDRQMAYAFRHWNDYNVEAYGDFNIWGGDCMNFVSQTLIARGWTPTPEWHNTAAVDWTSPFVYVPDFDAWMTAHPEFGAQRLGMADVDRLSIGDVVMIDWEGNGYFNHAQVISGFEVVDGERRVLMVGHNIDSTYRDLERAMAAAGGNGVAVFWSLPPA